MAERDSAVDSKDGDNDREPLACAIKSLEREKTGLLLVVDVKISGRGQDRAAFGAILVSRAGAVRG